MPDCFFALIPENPLYDFLCECKQVVRLLAGEQQYLSDSPHLTLFAGSFKEWDDIKAEIPKGFSLKKKKLKLSGWNTFFSDSLTGGHSLVIKVSANDLDWLREFQMQIANSIQGCRNKSPMKRYARTENFTPEMNASLEQFGFPYVGAIWKAHFTIASISSDYYKKIWEVLQTMKPPEFVTIKSMSYNEIHNFGFSEIHRWNL